MLVATLRPGDVVVMDNLSPHKTVGVQEAIEAPVPRFATFHPIHRTSIPSNSCGRKSNTIFVSPLPERTVNSLWP